MLTWACFAVRVPYRTNAPRRSNFIITGSTDGCIMFWTKKVEGGIEFVKKFRAHLGSITGMAASADGLYLATASDDMSLKIYDVLNFGK